MKSKKSPAEVRVGNLLNLRVSLLPTSPTPVTNYKSLLHPSLKNGGIKFVTKESVSNLNVADLNFLLLQASKEEKEK